MTFDVAILGATGMVGREIVSILAEKNFPINNLYLYASSKSAGEKLDFQDKKITVRELTMNNLESCDFYLSSLPRNVSKKFLPRIQNNFQGLIVDNSSAFRLDPDIPLIVPEVNGEKIKKSDKLIANPNCSTIQLVMVLNILAKKYGLQKVLVSTYQSVSGSGAEALNALEKEAKNHLENAEVQPEYYAHPIAFNLLPAIDYFHDDGFSQEEVKMRKESKKILGLANLEINCTCVRVPIEFGHAETVYLELDSNFKLQEVRSSLDQTPGVRVLDEPENNIYPTPRKIMETDEVLVGRIRRDRDNKNSLHLYLVANNIRKGAALNAVQIAERFYDGE